MPAIQDPASSTVFLTGASGFVGAWILSDLLEKGYGTVRIAVRSAAKGQGVIADFPQYKSRIEPVIVEDFQVPGAFDEAIKGVHGIISVATPINMKLNDPDDVIKPAVNTNKNILEAALKYGSSTLQRIVLTSACITAGPAYSATPIHLDETCWNDSSVKNVDENGKDADPLEIYGASKVLAEQTAWKFVEDHKSEIKWDLVTLLPPYIFGPLKANKVDAPEHLNASNAYIWEIVSKGSAPRAPNLTANPQHAWIDVRDCSLFHVHALTNQAAGSQRVLIVNESFCFQDLLDAANAVAPSVVSKALPQGDTKGARSRNITFDSSKMHRIFPEVKQHSKEDLMRDCLQEYKGNGWLE